MRKKEKTRLYKHLRELIITGQQNFIEVAVLKSTCGSLLLQTLEALLGRVEPLGGGSYLSLLLEQLTENWLFERRDLVQLVGVLLESEHEAVEELESDAH